ncbi:MAG TPA: VOC family protein [Solirubrobacterales bacterium]|nr:VOC family protein [Solirubrobacterales bacterium]
MIDHMGIEVSDFERSKAFYEKALEPLGISLLMEPVEGTAAGFGKDTEHGPKPFFWIGARGRPPVHGTHVAFGVRTAEQVDAFHAAAVAAGGTDNGPPGARPIYHPGYYGAFVLDPDGNNIEAVCHSAGQG